MIKEKKKQIMRNPAYRELYLQESVSPVSAVVLEQSAKIPTYCMRRTVTSPKTGLLGRESGGGTSGQYIPVFAE